MYFSKLSWKWSKNLCLCHDLPENNVTSKLSGQLKCTFMQLNTDMIVFQGSMANHFMEMECKIWWCYHDFCFIFLFFPWGVDGVVYITKYLFLLHCLITLAKWLLEFLGIKVWISTVNSDWEFLGIPRNSQP